eukprot:TRINITY_DN3795_c0_g1_i1.p1 TRINITY_DN3795_c0_g1~~TRINITY_DN3795_c0_g1_i1.p1  ORF type:complete len:385 (+),score=68.34 TRINITY_DN3795_c0_g1_i1:81-1157(+)
MTPLFLLFTTTTAALTLQSKIDGFGKATDMKSVGTLLYVSSNESGLVILNMNSPTDPKQLGTHPAVAQPSAIDVTGDTVYIAGKDELMVLNTSDPSNPKPLGTLPITNCTALTIVKQTLYITSSDGLQILNVTDPSSITPISDINLQYTVQGMALQWGIAYITAGDVFALINVSPTEPTVAVTMTSQENNNTGHRAVDVLGNVAYVAVENGGLQTFDITSPSKPVALASYCDGCVSGTNVVVYESTAYLTTVDGMQAVDVGSPASPRMLSSYKFSSEDVNSAIASSGISVFVGRSDGVYAFEHVSSGSSSDETATAVLVCAVVLVSVVLSLCVAQLAGKRGVEITRDAGKKPEFEDNL